MYHRISETGADRELLCVPPTEFALHVRQLRRDGYQVVPLEEIARGLEHGDMPARAVAITFDDGYLDSLTAAAPVLIEYEMPASFFVVTGAHERTEDFWWDTLERVLGDASPSPARLEISASGAALDLPTADPASRRDARERLKRTLIRLAREERDAFVADLVRWSGGAAPASTDARAMTAAEIRQLDGMPGMSVGSHTVNHLMLPAQSRAVRQAELAASRRSLEVLLARNITSLCYPYGSFDAETVAAAREAGYQCAVATGNLPVDRASDTFAIPRLAVRAGDDLASRLKGVFR
jgi:peptidoglycan/xylan/chitin deacetylase (PgdA/CDA1 family)